MTVSMLWVVPCAEPITTGLVLTEHGSRALLALGRHD
jgi:hypothetical protein